VKLKEDKTAVLADEMQVKYMYEYIYAREASA
jgi:hypothetical protein